MPDKPESRSVQRRVALQKGEPMPTFADKPETLESDPVIFEPLLTDLRHTRSCPSLTPLHEEDCTCGLVWRIRLRTEMEMHNAWRKRAEEAERLAPIAAETLESVLTDMQRFPGGDIASITIRAQAKRLTPIAARLRELIKEWREHARSIDDGTRGITSCSFSAYTYLHHADELEAILGGKETK